MTNTSHHLFDFSTPIHLENDRMIIAPLEATDKDRLKDVALQDRQLLQFSPSEIHSEERLQHYIEQALKAKAEKLRYPLIIFDKATQQYAGSTSFGNVSNKDLRLEIGWTWLGKDFQGTGLNQACKYLMLQFAFETLSFARVEFKIDSRNQQSRRAVEKIGGKYEGELRSHTLMINGFRRNTVYYSILRDEWPSLKPRLLA